MILIHFEAISQHGLFFLLQTNDPREFQLRERATVAASDDGPFRTMHELLTVCNANSPDLARKSAGEFVSRILNRPLGDDSNVQFDWEVIHTLQEFGAQVVEGNSTKKCWLPVELKQSLQHVIKETEKPNTKVPAERLTKLKNKALELQALIP